MKLRYLLLVIFGLVTAVPLALFWAWPHSQSMTNEMEDVRERHLLIAESLGIALENYHREVTTTFRLVHTRLIDPDETEGAGEILKNLYFRYVCVFDAVTRNVQLRVETPANPCPDTLDQESFDFYSGLAAAAAVGVSPVMEGPEGTPTIFLAAQRENRLTIGALSTEFFVQLAQSIAFGRRGYAIVVDQNGRVLAHPNGDWRRDRHNLMDVLPLQLLRSGEAGVTTFDSVSLQTEVVAGYTPVDSVGWVVLVAQPLEELRERAARVSHSALMVVVIGMLAALVIGYLVAFYMTRPLRAVSRAVRRMAAGNIEARTRVSTGILVPEEVRDLQTSFNVMAEAMERSKRDEQDARLRAEEANRSKSAFLANMSHELRTPLNAVLGFSEVILAETFGKIGSDRYTEYLKDIRTSARHLLALINDLLDLSRIEAGAVKLNEEWIELSEALEESAGMFREACDRKGLILRLEEPDTATTILADERALRQILINLLSNAVRHTSAGGEVVLGASQAPEGRLALFVADTGIGIPESDLERVLQPFEQVARDQGRPQEGTGLGLSIVKQLVDLHGGDLRLESTVGKGTRVSFTLPAERVRAADSLRKVHAGE